MKKFLKRCISIVLFVCLITAQLSTASASSADSKKFVTIDIEVFTLGQGYFIEPVLIPYEEGDTAAKITMKLFERYGIEYTSTGSVESGDFYLASIKDADKQEVDIPEYITEHGGPSNDDNVGNDDEYLGEFDYSSMSGWMITVNNTMIPVGAASYDVNAGDVVRWQFTVWGYGADLGCNTGWGDPSYYTEADKSQLLTAIADVNENHEELKTSADYIKASQTASTYNATQEQVDEAKQNLDKVIKNQESKVPSNETKNVKELSDSIDNLTKSVSDYMLATVTNPVVGSIGGEWAVLELGRSGYVTDDFKKVYLDNAKAYVEGKKGVLHSVKYTEYSRMILALTAIGEDPRAFAGYDLVAPLSDFKKVIKQGINGPIFALIAMDCGNYEFTTIEQSENQNTREKMIDYILGKELSEGGWALSGTAADPDITAMAIQSLAKYYDKNEKVKTAVDSALQKLSILQNEQGGYSSWGTVNSESIAQVIVALCELGIDPAKDERFIKQDGSWLLSALMDFKVDTEHGVSFGHASLETNQMATEQAAYALVAYERLLNKKSSLYDMMDVAKSGLGVDDSVIATGECGLVVPSIVSNTVNTTFNVNLRIGSFAENTKVLQTVLNVSPYLEVTGVTTSNQLLNGNLDYNLENQKLRIVYGDFTKNDKLEFTGDLPADIITIGFRIKQSIPTDTSLIMSLEEMKEIISSEEIVLLKDVSNVKEIPVNPIGIETAVLYQGDGVDLIPEDKIAMKVTITGITDVTKQIGFTSKDQYATLYVSKDFVQSSGVQSYLMIVNANTSLEDLLNPECYQVYDSQKADQIAFGDTNEDTYIDAQDALNVVSAWLRKENTSVNSKMILTYNVNADQRIDTEDALAIVERFVSSQPFKIMTK